MQEANVIFLPWSLLQSLHLHINYWSYKFDRPLTTEKSLTWFYASLTSCSSEAFLGLLCAHCNLLTSNMTVSVWVWLDFFI